MERAAYFDQTRFYRYSLHRRWADGAPLLFVMLNPSVADATKDDPTVRRCIGFAHRLGYGAMSVVNVFALIATDPNELLEEHADGEDLCGVLNDEYLSQGSRGAGRVIVV